ncbi:MAG: ribosomal-processing cysteine protease Prp [Candidatus Eremiobacteraeota bacterium]|nr:ribosomal-processing cysteine protease Prp [Candidatus Eremiobacteraeota bacterium]
MLEVTVYRDGDRLAGLSASGHTEFAAHGEDIVCAAVSAILQAVRLGLAEHARAEVVARQEPGMLELSWAEDRRDDESVRAIVATAELAIEQIAVKYPDHVRLRRIDVRPSSRGTRAPRTGNT